MQVEFNNFSAKLDKLTNMDFKTFKVIASNQMSSSDIDNFVNT